MISRLIPIYTTNPVPEIYGSPTPSGLISAGVMPESFTLTPTINTPDVASSTSPSINTQGDGAKTTEGRPSKV